MNKDETKDHYTKEHNGSFINSQGEYFILSICQYYGKRLCGRIKAEEHIREEHMDND